MALNQFTLNQIEIDEFNMTHAVLGINKPAGMTSHDIVNQVRKRLRTKKVGHAGALDPFATGVLLVLVGKYTKLSDELMKSGKEYKCRVLLGTQTDTLDTEGKIIEDIDMDNFVSNIANKGGTNIGGEDKFQNIVASAVETFKNGYDQEVPIFSSVKVEGYKLRKLARQAESFEILDSEQTGPVENGQVVDNADKIEKSVKFKMKDGKEIVLKVPKRKVVFSKFEIDQVGVLKDEISLSEKTKGTKWFIDLTVGCSKGTYIRQLALDIGKAIGVPAMLISLERTKVGNINIASCVNVEDVNIS